MNCVPVVLTSGKLWELRRLSEVATLEPHSVPLSIYDDVAQLLSS